LAAWLALALGALGAHRFYLHGSRDGWAWVCMLPTTAGLIGLFRARQFGPDDRLAVWLMPLLGLMVTAAMLQAIVVALTPDDRWDARYNPQWPPHPTGWGAVLAAIFGLMLGGGVLMATLAFSGERFFDWQMQDDAATALSPGK
jgi:hypothetical protein